MDIILNIMPQTYKQMSTEPSRSSICKPPYILFCVGTGNKLPYYEPLDVQLRKS